MKTKEERKRVHTFELAVYLNEEDGTHEIDWEWTGEPIFSMHAIGYIEAAKQSMYDSQFSSE